MIDKEASKAATKRVDPAREAREAYLRDILELCRRTWGEAEEIRIRHGQPPKKGIHYGW